MAKIAVGQIWRDTYDDGVPLAPKSAERFHNQRTVRVLGQEEDGRWLVEPVTTRLGQVPRGPSARKSRVSEKTLLSGYSLLSSANPA